MELEHLRQIALRAISPIRPADSHTAAPRDFLFTAKEAAASCDLPPHYLVYFLLVDLLGFKNLGQFEKISWSVPIDLDGLGYLIDYRKFGHGVFTQHGAEHEQQARRIVQLIRKGVKAAHPYFQRMAEDAVKYSKINVRNLGRTLYQRYAFFEDAYNKALTEAAEVDRSRKASLHQRELPLTPMGASFKRPDGLSIHEFANLLINQSLRQSQVTGYLALAAVDAFFSWTEHIFIHLALLQGKICTGDQVVTLAQADWENKFKSALELHDVRTKCYFDELIILRRQLRNFVTHGAFGKDGQAFMFHSSAGAVPVILQPRSTNKFSLTPELTFDNSEALTAIENFIEYLWSDSRAPAKIYIQESDLPLNLRMAEDGTYVAAMADVDSMTKLVNRLERDSDVMRNMDW